MRKWCVLSRLFPHLYNVCEARHTLLLSIRPGSGCRTALAVPGEHCLLPGRGCRPGQVTGAWGPWLLPACVAPATRLEGVGQGPGWTGICALLGGLPLCPGHLPTVIRGRELPSGLRWEKLKARDPSHALGPSWGDGSALPSASSTQCLLLTFLHRPRLPPSTSCRAGPSERPAQPALGSGFVSGAPSPLRRPRRPVPPPPMGAPAYPCCRPRRRLCCSTSW